MKSELVRLARAQGFDLCRIARAAEAPHSGAYRDWLKAGHAATMDWMGRDPGRRSDLRTVLPGARSVVVLAVNYWQGPFFHPQNGADVRGKIARYALGGDYHDWMMPRLAVLERFLADRGGTQKAYCDTGPVLERDFAAMAGVGWHGKSTLLLNRTLGTWFFLAEILTTLDLPSDDAEPDRCGSCTRCIDACPTGAILAPHVLDARRCISFLTIENKGPIPPEHRRAVGGRIYGCDDCLEACPWNRFAHASREAHFAGRTASDMALRDFLALDNRAFRALFEGSPIARIRRARFLRNVCVALGNIGSMDDLSALDRAAADPHPLISEHAAWAADQLRKRHPVEK